MLEGKKPGRRLTAGLAVFLLVMARYCAFGLRYYPQLDDYIQYHNYIRSYSFMALQEKVGILASGGDRGLLFLEPHV